MKKGANNGTDERFALGLLCSHLATYGTSEFDCKVNPHDPPDLIVTWKQGERWGVEVTRTYQQVQQIGKEQTASFQAVSAYLRKFGEEIGRVTEGVRRRGYTLCLDSPSSLGSWKGSVPLREWRKEAEERIRKHILSDEDVILRFPGGRLRPGAPGNGWSLMINGPATHLPSTITATLACSLTDKAKRLEHWKERFERCWLLILNCDPLADDAAEVESILRGLVLSDPELAGFDGVLWSGISDRTLLQISLS